MTEFHEKFAWCLVVQSRYTDPHAKATDHPELVLPLVVLPVDNKEDQDANLKKLLKAVPTIISEVNQEREEKSVYLQITEKNLPIALPQYSNVIPGIMTLTYQYLTSTERNPKPEVLNQWEFRSQAQATVQYAFLQGRLFLKLDALFPLI